ncbi:MAG: hypothetical protein WAZ50_00795 [Minisyncoccia bacterium]
MKRFLILVVFSLISPLVFVYAQSANPIQELLSSGVTLVAFPNIPGPNTPVNISIQSTTIDLETANIDWIVNKQNYKSGVGLKEIDVTTGPSGVKTTVQVNVSSQSGYVQKTIEFTSSDIDLLWMGRGYVPPFYKGKTLWGAQTLITFTAIPHVLNSNGQELNPNSLIYKWIKDGFILGNVSGVGKNSLSLSDSILSIPIKIEVQVLTDGDTVVADKEVTFTPQKQDLLIYENSPLYGVLFNKYVEGTYSTEAKEISFSAFPLFFGTIKRDSQNIIYNWQPNSVRSGALSNITYRAPEDTSVSSNVSLEVRSSSMVLQNVSRNFRLQFNNSPSL